MESSSESATALAGILMLISLGVGLLVLVGYVYTFYCVQKVTANVERMANALEALAARGNEIGAPDTVTPGLTTPGAGQTAYLPGQMPAAVGTAPVGIASVGGAPVAQAHVPEVPQAGTAAVAAPVPASPAPGGPQEQFQTPPAGQPQAQSEAQPEPRSRF